MDRYKRLKILPDPTAYPPAQGPYGQSYLSILSEMRLRALSTSSTVTMTC